MIAHERHKPGIRPDIRPDIRPEESLDNITEVTGMTAKQEKFEQVLTQPFSMDTFVPFTRELLTDETMVAPNKYNKEYSNFSYHIAGYTHIANYYGSDRKKAAIFAVELKKGESVERARSMQRNFVKRLMINGSCDAALVAFYTSGEPKWRLSFIRMDYEFAKGKISTLFTPAKRYSYLVGEGEPSHTAKSRLFPIFQEEGGKPSIDEIEEAFSVEKVTREFFEQYSEKYHQVREWLEASPDFMAEAEYHKFTSEQFAKKLMGQIAFLYFVQKKGWLGVNALPRTLNEKEYKNAFFARGVKSRELLPLVFYKAGEDEYRLNAAALDSLSSEDEEILASCVKGQPWGTGPKDFIRRLFVACEKKGENYFNDYLEPLFYEALNTNRGENGYFPALHCRIPFLNGGLFEQLDNYDWKHNNFAIPNDIFSNASAKGREADGILDIFDRYNFTINEDEPMEKEVAIDPEMLGKIFENLLDVKDRKSKGAFYTPREIVHYMCQESLANYLVNVTALPYDDIRDFISYGDFMKDEDTASERQDTNGTMLIPGSIFDMKSGVNRLRELDDALAGIRIADPAVGSGAFPLGMLNEIIRARQNISAYMSIPLSPQARRLMYAFDRHPYVLKMHTVKNCIYAADVEPSAVDIAKLRLWLSLVIDDEINPNARNEMEGHSKPRALPNLDCNIICRNSLVDEFMGIKLINQSELFGSQINGMQMYLGQNQYEGLLNRLFESQDRLFSESGHEARAELKSRIQGLIDTIIMFNLHTAAPEVIEKYNEVKMASSLPYCLWELEFGRVFREKGGFDIVIGNPPYIDSENMVNSGMEELRNTISENYSFTRGNWDIYIAFFEKSFRMLSKNGILSFITPDKWISKPFGDEMRKNLIANINTILAAGRSVFESALVDSIITFIAKRESGEIKVLEMADRKSAIVMKRNVDKKILSSPFALDIIFSDAIGLISRLESENAELAGRFTCENACATSDCYRLKDILYSLRSADEFDPGTHMKVTNTGTIGRFVSRWGYQPMTYLKDKYLYPVVDKSGFLDMFTNTYGQKSIKMKIIIKGLTLLDCFIDFDGTVIPGKSTMLIPCEDAQDLKYLSAFINCRLMIFFIKQKYSSSSYNGGINFTKDMINHLPWREPSNDLRSAVTVLVDEIIARKLEDSLADTCDLEERIDEYMFGLYQLTHDEISIVRDS